LGCRTMRWKPRCEVAVSIACGMRATGGSAGSSSVAGATVLHPSSWNAELRQPQQNCRMRLTRRHRWVSRLTSVNEQGMNDPQVDQDENDRPKRLNRDKQEIGDGLDAHEDDAKPASPGSPRDDSKPSRQNNKTHNQVPPAPRGRARTDPVVGWLNVESAPNYQRKTFEKPKVPPMIITTAAKVAPPVPRSLTTFSLTMLFPPSVGFHERSGAAQPE
jgi:hypothetical protein